MFPFEPSQNRLMSAQHSLVLFSPFLLALLVLLIPNTTENHAITYTNSIGEV